MRDYDRQAILAECLRAWRVNPIARRIVKIISMFIVGEGIKVQSDHKATQEYLVSWWDHPLNRLGRSVVSFCDEATRSGNLFFCVRLTRLRGCYMFVPCLRTRSGRYFVLKTMFSRIKL